MFLIIASRVVKGTVRSGTLRKGLVVVEGWGEWKERIGSEDRKVLTCFHRRLGSQYPTKGQGFTACMFAGGFSRGFCNYI